MYGRCAEAAAQAHPVLLDVEDRRALNALFWTNVDPYGRFRLDTDTCLDLDLAA
jgi:hypothetical protein